MRARSRHVVLLWVIAGCSPTPATPTTGGSSTTQSTTAGGSGASTTTIGPLTTTTTAGATTTTTAGSESDPSSGCPFVCESDLPEDPWACSPTAQDCPDVDGQPQKCTFYVPFNGQGRREGTRCIPVTGDNGPYEPCTLPTGFGAEITDDCDASGYCLEVYQTADHGFCAPYCDDPFNCDEYPGASHSQENGSSFPEACLYGDCDPFDPLACPDEMRCVFYPAWLYDSTQCWKVPPGGLGLGASCDYGQCAPGHLCLPSEFVPGCDSARCCTEWCAHDAPACTDPQAVCEGTWVGVNANAGACVIEGSTDP